MSIWRTYREQICRPLDGLLWRQGINHSLIGPLLRNQILVSGSCLLAGGIAYVFWPGVFWFGAGMACMAWIFWSWARFFASAGLGQYNAAFLRAVLWSFGSRLVLMAVLLWLAMAFCGASAWAILAGVASGAVMLTASFAWRHMRKN